MRTFYTLIINIAVISWTADGARILQLFPIPIEVNQRFIQPLLKELDARRPQVVAFTSLALQEYPSKLNIVSTTHYSSTMKTRKKQQKYQSDKNPRSLLVGEDGSRTLANVIWFRQLGTEKAEWTFPQNDFNQLIESDRTYIFLAIKNCQESFTTLRYRFYASEITSSNRHWAHYLHRIFSSHESYIGYNNMTAFITHWELPSLIEALESGVAAVAIPLAWHQTNNTSNLEHNVLGFKLIKTNFTAETISWTIQEILGNPKYRENAKKRSQFRDKPETALEKAVFWTEYVIRHNGAHHLKPAIVTMPWYQQAMIDVYLTIALIVIIPVYIFIKLLKLLFSMCGCNKAKEY